MIDLLVILFTIKSYARNNIFKLIVIYLWKLFLSRPYLFLYLRKCLQNKIFLNYIKCDEFSAVTVIKTDYIFRRNNSCKKSVFSEHIDYRLRKNCLQFSFFWRENNYQINPVLLSFKSLFRCKNHQRTFYAWWNWNMLTHKLLQTSINQIRQKLYDKLCLATISRNSKAINELILRLIFNMKR